MTTTAFRGRGHGEHGRPGAGAITAALYRAEFVGAVPWAHLDICGPMQVADDESWHSKGATGFGARLLAELAVNFTPPKGYRPGIDGVFRHNTPSAGGVIDSPTQEGRTS
jgi:hypothetical protein